jgi:alpha/beta superfamily hydrolase
MSNAFFIPGPVGDIETELTPAATHEGRWAILCHPHPMMGGNMHDQVVGMAAAALATTGVSTLRFNFRGAGASAGSHDDGVGEVDDLLAVYAWLKQGHAPSTLILGGYSFGSNIAWQAQARLDDVEHVLLIAPVVTHMDYTAPPAARRTSVIAGDSDDFVELGALDAWANGRFDVTIIPGENHFFSTGGAQLQQLVAEMEDD